MTFNARCRQAEGAPGDLNRRGQYPQYLGIEVDDALAIAEQVDV